MMRKLILIIALALFGFTSNAQDTNYGVLGGLSFMTGTSEFDGFGETTESETGFHIGAFAEFGLSEAFALQPELTYELVDGLSFINLNAIAKYEVAEGFSLQLGPQFALAGGDDVNDLDDLLGDDFTKLNIRLAAGAGYDINEEIFVQARYGFQLNDHITADGGSLTFNVLNVSVGYRF